MQSLIVVDIEVRSREVLAYGLGRAGFSVHATADTGEAIRMAQSGAAQVVVASLPEGGGSSLTTHAMFTALGQRGAATPKVPVVAIGDSSRRAEAMAAGASEFIARPAFLRDIVIVSGLAAARGDAREIVGRLEDCGIYFLARALHTMRRSAHVLVERNTVRGRRIAQLIFENGDLIDAHVGRQRGSNAYLELLLWPDGRLYVDFGEPLSGETRIRRIQRPTERLLDDGPRFVAEFREVAARIGGADAVYRLEAEVVADEERKIPREVRAILPQFDGTRTVRELVEDSPFPPFDMLVITHRLADLGAIVRLADRAATDASEPKEAAPSWLLGGEALLADSSTEAASPLGIRPIVEHILKAAQTPLGSSVKPPPMPVTRAVEPTAAAALDLPSAPRALSVPPPPLPRAATAAKKLGREVSGDSQVIRKVAGDRTARIKKAAPNGSATVTAETTAATNSLVLPPVAAPPVVALKDVEPPIAVPLVAAAAVVEVAAPLAVPGDKHRDSGAVPNPVFATDEGVAFHKLSVDELSVARAGSRSAVALPMTAQAERPPAVSVAVEQAGAVIAETLPRGAIVAARVVEVARARTRAPYASRAPELDTQRIPRVVVDHPVEMLDMQRLAEFTRPFRAADSARFAKVDFDPIDEEFFAREVEVSQVENVETFDDLGDFDDETEGYAGEGLRGREERTDGWFSFRRRRDSLRKPPE